MTDLSRFDGKIAVITGAAQGIGEATARLLAKRGAAGLVLTDRQPEKLEAVARSLREHLTVETVVADLVNTEQLLEIIPAAEARFGRIDVLANIAALTARGGILDTSLEQWDELFAANLRAPFALMQGALRVMERHAIQGTIVNILSVHAYGGAPFLTPYSTSKGALAILTRNVAHSVLRLGIRVNGINLGWTDTPGERAHHGERPQWINEAARELPLGRLIEPDEVARLIAFLASGESGIMTGALLDFDQSVIGTSGSPGLRWK